MCTPWLLILQPQHLRIALSQGKKKAWMFNLPVSLPPTISSINCVGLKDTLVCLLFYCPAFFSFVLSLNNITITPSFLCLLSSLLPDSLSPCIYLPLLLPWPHALLTACRMDDAEACFILSNRFEVDRIAAVRSSLLPCIAMTPHTTEHPS